MAFDACMMRAVISEIALGYTGAKVERVLEPQNDELDLVIHAGRSTKRLIMNVGPNSPRIQLSDMSKENPAQAPMFCMQMRKHLLGARLVSAEQMGFDRIAVLTFQCFDELGFASEKKLICEIMGKYANLVFTDAEFRIISAMKIIDFADSTVRQVIPGMSYQVPVQSADKVTPLVVDRAFFMRRYAEFPGGRSGEKFITSNYLGIATQTAHEIVYTAAGRIDVPLSEMDPERFFKAFSDWQNMIAEERYEPCVMYDGEGKAKEYSYMLLSYLDGYRAVKFKTFGEMFDVFFEDKDRNERIRQRAHDLINIVSHAITRTEKKLSIYRESLLNSERADEYKKYGDLITANIYRIKRGDTELSAVDYYSDDCPEVIIPLDERSSPSANAQRMYKQYAKLKKSREILAEQSEKAEHDLKYLESVSSFLASAQTESDLAEIREELYRCGYSSRMKGYIPPKTHKIRPLEYVTPGGFRLLVGRNNTQNDYVTFKAAEKRDIWFHVKGVPGSHVILVTEGKEPSDDDYTAAAETAAYYSAATGDTVAVDYTEVRNVKKPAGSNPGFVIFKTNSTAYVKRILRVKSK